MQSWTHARAFLFLIAGVSLVAADEVSAQGASFRALGVPEGYMNSLGRVLSEDGSIVAGWLEIEADPPPPYQLYHSFRWSSGVMEVLPALSNLDWAVGMSRDGCTIMGTTGEPPGPQQTFQWSEGAGTTLAPLPADHAIVGASADLEVLIGWAPAGAFYWTGAGGTVYLPELDWSNGISPSGHFIVGSAGGRIARVHIGQAAETVPPPAGWTHAWGAAISNDGKTVVGSLDGPGLPLIAFAWRPGTGYEVLPAPPGPATFAVDVSARGLVIVGLHYTGSYHRTAVWSNGVYFDLYDLLTQAGATEHLGWRLEVQPSLSVNGRILAGGGANARGYGEGYIAVLPEGFDCYGNCDMSLTPPVLNVADFTCFLQRFAAADPYTNCDQSTTPPVLNVADFTCFLQRYAAGCP